MLITNLKHRTIWQLWKVDQLGLVEILSFCIEEGHGASDGWLLMHKIDIVKNAKQR